MDTADRPPAESTTRARVPLPKRHSFVWIWNDLKANRYGIYFSLEAAFFLSFWHFRATHHFALRPTIVFVFLCGLSFCYGHLFTRLTAISAPFRQSIAFQFLCGYFCVSTLLFLLSLFTPLKVATNLLILSAAVPVSLFLPSRTTGASSDFADHLPDFLCLVISGLGATFWCIQPLEGLVNEGATMLSRTFPDTFFHARQISGIAQADGLRALSDLRMAGAHAPIYHHGGYLIPAAVYSLTNSTAYATFVSFLLPFGILLSGIAAFALASSFWGMWPGVAASIALVLLPDAYQQGFGNRLLSYSFFQQTGPTGLYGVAAVALAWVFMLAGCRTGKFRFVVFAYTALVFCLIYKAHFFVANAFLILIYPCVFFRSISARRRLISGIVLTAIFVCVVNFSQRFDFIPTLRLDGSGTEEYVQRILNGYDPGFLRSFFDSIVRTHLQSHSQILLACDLAGMLILSTFGWWTLVGLGIFLFSRKLKIGTPAIFFPWIIFVNSMVMSLGLALDQRNIGGPTQLLHRPFVWSYFAIAAWSSAGIYALFFGEAPPKSRVARILTILLLLSTFGIPLVFGKTIQLKNLAWQSSGSYGSFNSIPVPLVEACGYIRNHSAGNDIIQDSEKDPGFVVTALAERQAFVADPRIWGGKHRVLEGLGARLNELIAAEQMTNEADLRAYMQAHRISWYLLRPQSKVAWPESFLKQPAFDSGDYRLYHFTQ
jgi:hypothetical protein